MLKCNLEMERLSRRVNPKDTRSEDAKTRSLNGIESILTLTEHNINLLSELSSFSVIKAQNDHELILIILRINDVLTSRFPDRLLTRSASKVLFT